MMHFEITSLGRPPTMNLFRRSAWQSNRALVEEWRRAAFWHTRRAVGARRLRRGGGQPGTAVRVRFTPLHANRRTPQDTAACAPAAKAALDGIVDAGYLEDDSPDWVAEIVFAPPEVCGRDGLRVEVSEAC